MELCVCISSSLVVDFGRFFFVVISCTFYYITFVIKLPLYIDMLFDFDIFFLLHKSERYPSACRYLRTHYLYGTYLTYPLLDKISSPACVKNMHCHCSLSIFWATWSIRIKTARYY